MFTVAENKFAEYKIKNSNFKSYIYNAHSIIDVKNKINNLTEKYPDSSHICYAYRFSSKDNLDLFNNPNYDEFCTDAGEPSGTAGRPILNVIKQNKLVNVTIIVIRFYGGTKLGIRGLINAYTESAKLTIKDIKLNKWIISKKIYITYEYKFEKSINKIIDSYDLKVNDSNYSSLIKQIISIEIKEYETIIKTMLEKTNGTIQIENCIY